MTEATGTAPAVALDQLPLMLTVEEAARVLRIGRNGAYAAVADGSLPSVRIGRRIRIPRACLATLLHVSSDPNGASPAPGGTPAQEPTGR